MKLYLFIINLAMLLIALVNIIAKTAAPLYVIAAVIGCTALQFLLDGILAILISHLPDRWFSAKNPLFHVTKAELSLYRRLHIKKWKDKVWELGGLGGFSKKDLERPNDPAYIERFIVECNKGVVIHRLSYGIGFTAMLLFPTASARRIALPVALVNLLLNILPTIVLRSNTPLLQMLLHRLQRRSEPDGTGQR